MSVKLNRPPNPEESQKNSNFNGKTIPYPGFEPGTSGLAVGRHNHCTIWVGQPAVYKIQRTGEYLILSDSFSSIGPIKHQRGRILLFMSARRSVYAALEVI
jgi:hypothetical protein